MRSASAIILGGLSLALAACGGLTASPSSDAGAQTSAPVVPSTPPPPSSPDAGTPARTCNIDPPAPPVACVGAAAEGGEPCVNLFNPCDDPTGNHKAPGERCENGSQCTSYDCSGGVCISLHGAQDGEPCVNSYDCVDKVCVGGTCSGPPLCRIRTFTCSSSSQCMHHDCVSGACGCAGGCFVGASSPCTTDYECSSLRCRDGACGD